MRHNLFICVLVGSMVAACSRSPHSGTFLSAALQESLEATVLEKMDREKIPGLSLAVMSEGALVWSRGFGYADVENAVPATTETVYRLASVSKTMTAMAAMVLAEKGRLDLDKPVQTYCPAFPEKQGTLTARHLLAHTGGVRHYSDTEDPQSLGYKHFNDTASALEIFKDDPLRFEPGTDYLYTTFGFQVLGCAIEGASGQTLLQTLKRNVWDPSGLTRTQVDDSAALIPHRAQGYRLSENGWLNSAMTDTSYKVPGGGLSSTAEDLARFGDAVLTHKLVSAKTLGQMFTEIILPDGRGTKYGLGWILGTSKWGQEVYHTGSQERVRTVLYFIPDKRLIVTVLANLEEAVPLALARQITEQVLTSRGSE